MKITKEQLKKAETAKSMEELLELAKAEDIELTAEDAEKAFDELLKTGELADEELDNVAGGGCDDSEPTPVEEADREEDVVYYYKIGQEVEVYDVFGSTKKATIVKQYPYQTNNGSYCPAYVVKFSDGTEKNVRQAGIEKS